MKNRLEILVTILSLIAFSLVGFTYMHSNFPTKDIFQMVCQQLENLNNKIDTLDEKIDFIIFEKPKKGTK